MIRHKLFIRRIIIYKKHASIYALFPLMTRERKRKNIHWSMKIITFTGSKYIAFKDNLLRCIYVHISIFNKPCQNEIL